MTLEQLQEQRALLDHYGPGALSAFFVAELFTIAEASLATASPELEEVVEDKPKRARKAA